MRLTQEPRWWDVLACRLRGHRWGPWKHWKPRGTKTRFETDRYRVCTRCHREKFQQRYVYGRKMVIGGWKRRGGSRKAQKRPAGWHDVE